MKKYIICFLLLGSSILIPAEKIRIAIMDLQPLGEVSPDLALNVSSILRNELAATQRFIVVDLANLDSVQQEQARQQTGCTEQSCAVKIGNILNVQKIVVGTMGKIGGMFEIRISFVDVERGQLEISTKVQAQNEGRLSTVSEHLAKKIAAKIGLQGKILSDEGKGMYLINIGRDDGVDKGTELEVVRVGEAIIDEETGEFYGRKQEKIGKITITELQGPQLSLVKKEKKSKDFQKNDRVIIEGKDIEAISDEVQAQKQAKAAEKQKPERTRPSRPSISRSPSRSSYRSTPDFNIGIIATADFGLQNSGKNEDTAIINNKETKYLAEYEHDARRFSGELYIGPFFGSAAQLLFTPSDNTGTIEITGVLTSTNTNQTTSTEIKTYNFENVPIGVNIKKIDFKAGLRIPIKGYYGNTKLYGMQSRIQYEYLYYESFRSTDNNNNYTLTGSAKTIEYWETSGYGGGMDIESYTPIGNGLIGIRVPLGFNFVWYPLENFKNSGGARVFPSTLSSDTAIAFGLGAHASIGLLFNWRLPIFAGAVVNADYLRINIDSYSYGTSYSINYKRMNYYAGLQVGTHISLQRLAGR